MLPVTPRPRSWSGVCVSIAFAATSLAPSFPVPVVALRIELSTTRLSAVSGPPALDYRFQSGTPESNRPRRMPQTANTAPAPEAGVLPSAPLPVCLQSERPALNRGHRPARMPVGRSWSPGPQAGTPRDARLRHVLSPTARTTIAVGREVLESSSPGFQPGATPSQLPTPTKKARRLL